MKDSYFYKSLAATLLVYTAILCTFVAFVLAAGFIGVFIISLIVIYFLCYFYGVFGKVKLPAFKAGHQQK
ncbi:MAG: hypothetical protein ABFR82_14560 [Nitrospirota bacterium]